jgi:hypothetical protein
MPISACVKSRYLLHELDVHISTWTHTGPDPAIEIVANMSASGAGQRYIDQCQYDVAD